MNEFSLIKTYFNSIRHQRVDVIFGIGDDAACLHVPNDMDLLVSTDTLVAGVHFLSDWDPYAIASRALLVNISDMAAMAAEPCWVTLALTLPTFDESWLKRFSAGLSDTLQAYNIALVGGDTTRGPLSITLTIHGVCPKGQAIRRSGAKVGDTVYVSGLLGASALAVSFLDDKTLDEDSRRVLMDNLLFPKPRVDLKHYLRQHATAAIDVSDGLSADLNHILESSHVGACIDLEKIPVHPLVLAYKKENAIEFALNGGDDYELCFTMSNEHEPIGLGCYPIGRITEEGGLHAKTLIGDSVPIQARGYCHF